MHIGFGDITLNTTVVIDGQDCGSHTADRVIRFTVSKRQKDGDPVVIEFDLSPRMAVEVGTQLCRNAWDAEKDAMRNRGEVYRRLGFFH